MRVLEEFLKPSQKKLFKMLCKFFIGKTHVSEGNFLLVKGEVPIMLVAHLDTVHRNPVQDICKSKGGKILMSPQGIGGDDRCGVYALVNAYVLSKKKPWLLFTCDEEVGGIGANNFCVQHTAGKLPTELDALKLLIEIDRKGANDAVYYDCDNKEFEQYITSKGFTTAYGSFSDISVIAPELGVAAVNLSSGYHNPHTLHEYINREEIDAVLMKVIDIIAESARADFPKYQYVEKIREVLLSAKNDAYWTRLLEDVSFKSEISETGECIEKAPVRKKLSSDYTELYDELLETYTVEELERYRELCGDEVIYQIYIDEMGPFYSTIEK